MFSGWRTLTRYYTTGFAVNYPRHLYVYRMKAFLYFWSDDPDTKTSMVRLKRWEWTFAANKSCHGDIFRWICNIGLGDLRWVVQSKQFFVNKIRIELQPDAFNCLELWIKDRLRHERLVAQSDGQIRPSQLSPPYNYQFDIAYYESQPFVSNHV
jgi:hypothetical protein